MRSSCCKAERSRLAASAGHAVVVNYATNQAAADAVVGPLDIPVSLAEVSAHIAKQPLKPALESGRRPLARAQLQDRTHLRRVTHAGALDVHHAQDYYARWMAMSRDWRDRSSYSRRVLRNVFVSQYRAAQRRPVAAVTPTPAMRPRSRPKRSTGTKVTATTERPPWFRRSPTRARAAGCRSTSTSSRGASSAPPAARKDSPTGLRRRASCAFMDCSLTGAFLRGTGVALVEVYELP